MKHPDALRMVGAALQSAVLEASLDVPLLERKNGNLADLQARRGRLLAGYEAGIIPMGDYASRVAELDAAIEAEESATRNIAGLRYEAEQRREALISLKEDVDYLPSWITDVEPREVNAILRLLIDKIVTWEDDVRIVFKS